jgi:hypothetical protein
LVQTWMGVAEREKLVTREAWTFKISRPNN